MDSGDPDQAMDLAQEAVEISTRLEDGHSVAMARLYVAAAMLRSSRRSGAHDLMSSGAGYIIEGSDLQLVAEALDEFAPAATLFGADRRAARLAGAADRHREATSLPRPPPVKRHFEGSLGAARQRLGREAWDTEYARGRQLNHAEALTLASQPMDSRVTPSMPVRPGP